MASGPERNLIPIAEGITGRDTDFQNASRAIFANLEVLKSSSFTVEERQSYATAYFSSLATVPNIGYKSIFWLTRNNLDLIEVAAPLMRGATVNPTEEEDVEQRITALEQLRYEQEHPNEFTPKQHNLLQLSPEVERTIYNAIRYNDEGVNLSILPENDLPGIPGRVAINVIQEGDNWSVQMVLKTTPLGRKEEERYEEEIKQIFASFDFLLGGQPQLQEYYEEILTPAGLKFSIGSLGFAPTAAAGLRRYQNRNLRANFTRLVDTLPIVIGKDYQTEDLSSPQMRDRIAISIHNTSDDSEYFFGVTTLPLKEEEAYKTTENALVLQKTPTSPQRSRGSFEQFQVDLREELELVNGVLDWIYQNAGIKTNRKLPLITPDTGIQSIEGGSSYLQRVQESPTSFEDLGGQRALRQLLIEYTQDFIQSFQRRDGHLNPPNLILYGETGVGKTSLTNAIISELLKAKVPVYILKGDLYAQVLQHDVPTAIEQFNKVFFHVLINGGAIFVRDFDALLGTRGGKQGEGFGLVHAALLRELEYVKREPSTWLVADTQFILDIDKALINAQRIGKKLPVKVDTTREGVEEILTAIIRSADKELQGRESETFPLDVQLVYSFQYQQVAEAIISLGGIIPAQLDRIVREEMQSNRDQGYSINTESLIQRIRQFHEEEVELQELRRLQREEQLNRDTSRTLELVEDVHTHLLALEKELQELRKQLGVKKNQRTSKSRKSKKSPNKNNE